MKTSRWFAILAMVVSTSVWACSSSGGSKDVVSADVPTDVPPPVDTIQDPGTPHDPGTFDPGTVDPGTDPGTTTDIVVADTPSVDVPAGCPAVISGPTCSAIAACALQCTDSGREAACVGTAVAAEKTRWEALRDCLATAACPKVFDNEQFTDCVTTTCADAFGACFSATAGKCCAIVNCRKECDPDDPSCPMRCYGLASKAEQAVFDTYKDCVLETECGKTDLRANGWPTWTCEAHAQGTNCSIQSQNCFPTTGCN